MAKNKEVHDCITEGFGRRKRRGRYIGPTTATVAAVMTGLEWRRWQQRGEEGWPRLVWLALPGPHAIT